VDFDSPHGKLHQRLSTTASIFVILFILLSVRLWYLQAIRGAEYAALSQKNSIRLIRLRAPRGEVIDRHGEVLLTNRPGFNIVVFRSGKAGDNTSRDVLFSTLGVGKEFSDFPIRRFSPAKKDVPWEKVVWVVERKTNLPEVSIEVQPKRYYPGGQTTSHILGYIGEIGQSEMQELAEHGYSTGDMIGKSGVEKMFENQLRGKDGGKQIIVNAKGHQIKILGCKEPLPGSNIRLTIDYRIQKLIESAIGKKRGGIVVIDPRNGEILGLVSRPDFDPNIFTRPISSEVWGKLSSGQHSVFTNRVIQGQYPPASTFKLVVAAAALEEGLIGADDLFVCKGSYQVGNRAFRCWKRKGHGAVNITEGIVQSCDIFFYQLGQRVGVEKMAYYARKLGLGSPTGIDIPGEKAGLIPTPHWKRDRFRMGWYPGDTVNMSIGQGYVLTTPIQMANAFCTIANGGTLYKLHLLDAILTPEGKLIEKTAPRIIRQLDLKPQTKKILREAFISVVSRGTGRKAKVKGTDVAGKTGTSENPHGADHAWFIGFAPADSPRICVAVLLENAGQGGSVAAPICGKIIEGIMNFK
jgi:penicillin-binding protein 2